MPNMPPPPPPTQKIISADQIPVHVSVSNSPSRPPSLFFIFFGIIILFLIGIIITLATQFSKTDSPISAPTVPTITTTPSSIPLPTQNSTPITTTTPTIIIKNSPTPKPASPTPTPTPIPTSKTISISGFAYEDRNDDGVFNSNDIKLPYMQFYLYDSAIPNDQISTINSDVSGNFSISLNVRSGLTIKPTTYNNFRPRDTGSKTYTNSDNSLQFGFRSTSAPVAGVNNGLIEGDIYQDSNKNQIFDSSESGVYFYKLYLKDSQGNYYNTVENAQTTDPGGHFKFINLPSSETYTIQLSNANNEYDIPISTTTVPLTSTQSQKTGIKIPVFKY